MPQPSGSLSKRGRDVRGRFGIIAGGRGGDANPLPTFMPRRLPTSTSPFRIFAAAREVFRFIPLTPPAYILPTPPGAGLYHLPPANSAEVQTKYPTQWPHPPPQHHLHADAHSTPPRELRSPMQARKRPQPGRVDAAPRNATAEPRALPPALLRFASGPLTAK